MDSAGIFINALLELAENAAAIGIAVLFFVFRNPSPLFHPSRRGARFNLPGIALFVFLATFAMYYNVHFRDFFLDIRIAPIILAAFYLGPLNSCLVGVATIPFRLLQEGNTWLIWVIAAPFCGPAAAWIAKRVSNRLLALLLANLFCELIILAVVAVAMAGLPHIFRQGESFTILSFLLLYSPVLIFLPVATLFLDWIIRVSVSHQQMHQAVVEAETKYRAIVENSLVGICILQDRKLVYANKGLELMLGYSQQELLAAEDFGVFIVPEDRERANEIVRAKLRREEIGADGEQRLLCKDGRVMTAESFSSVIKLKGQTAVMAILVDNSEKKHSETLLRESEGRFRAIANSAPVLLWIADSELKCTFINRAWSNYTGDNCETALENGWYGHVHPDDLDYCIQTVRSAIVAKKECTMEFRLRGWSGNYAWFLTVATPRYSQAGTLMGVIGSSIDISDRKWAEEVLQREHDEMEERVALRTMELQQANSELAREIIERRRAESRYRELFNGAQDAVFVWSFTEQMIPGRFIEVNSIACKRLGYTREELLQKTPLQINAPRFRASAGKILPQLLTKRHILFESEYVRKDGGAIPVEVNVHVFDFDGKLTGISTARDITDRKQAEMEMVLTRERIGKAEKLVFLGTVAAKIAHEINQPLNAIRVTADSIEHWHREGMPYSSEELREDVQLISEQAERIAGIIRYMRNSVRSSSEEAPVAFNLNSSVKSALKIVSYQLEAGGINVEQNLQAALPAVCGSLAQLEQVIINLLVNAIQSIKESGKAERTIAIRTWADDKVHLAIADTGSGFPEEKKQKIFAPFFSTKADGMGLGLSIVCSIVKGHCGEIYASNNVHGGATFQVDLPLPTGLEEELP